jgi:chromosome segregation ATPase
LHQKKEQKWTENEAHMKRILEISIAMEAQKEVLEDSSHAIHTALQATQQQLLQQQNDMLTAKAAADEQLAAVTAQLHAREQEVQSKDELLADVTEQLRTAEALLQQQTDTVSELHTAVHAKEAQLQQCSAHCDELSEQLKSSEQDAALQQKQEQQKQQQLTQQLAASNGQLMLERERSINLFNEVSALKQLAADYAVRVLAVIGDQRFPTDATTDDCNYSSGDTANSGAHVIAGADSSSSSSGRSGSSNSSSRVSS